MSHSIPHLLYGAALQRLFGRIVRVPTTMSRLAQLRRERQALARLNRNLLDDIGLDPTAARTESGRAFWDAPNHWRL